MGVGNGYPVFGGKGVESLVQGAVVGTEEHDGSAFTGYQGEERGVVVTLVGTSDNEHHGCGLRFKRHVAGIDIRRLRIVDITNAMGFTDKFQTMFHTGKRPQAFLDGIGIHTCRQGVR